MKPGAHITSFLFLLLMLPALQAQEKVLKVGFHHWPPNQMLGTGNKPAGTDIELTKAIFARAGIPVEFQFYPWKRILYLLESGGIDVAMSAGYTEERGQFAWFTSQTYREGYNSLFIRAADKPKFQRYKTLTALQGSGLQLGATLGISYSDEYDLLIQDNSFKAQLNIVDRDRTNFELLAKGRIDAVLASETIGKRLIAELGYTGKLVRHMHLYGPEDASTYLMLSKKSVPREIVKRVDNAIVALKGSGEYYTILGNNFAAAHTTER